MNVRALSVSVHVCFVLLLDGVWVVVGWGLGCCWVGFGLLLGGGRGVLPDLTDIMSMCVVYVLDFLFLFLHYLLL